MSERTALRKCHICNHDKCFNKRPKRCSKCGSLETVLIAYKNANGSMRQKIVVK